MLYSEYKLSDWQGEGMDKDDRLVIDSIKFFASFAVYYLLIYFGIFGFGFGMQGFVFYYGFEAISLFLMLLWPYAFLVVFCLIRQIRFAKRNLKEHPRLKAAAITVAGITVLCFLSIIPISSGKKKSDAANDNENITKCLEERYGKEFASGIRIEKDDSKSDSYQRYYKVYTDVLPSNVYFTVYNDMPSNTYFIDDLMDTFKGNNAFFEGNLKYYIREKYGIPDDMELRLEIRTVDFKDYRNGDDLKVLFERTDYLIDMINMKVDSYSWENINSCITRVWNDVYPKIKDKIERVLFINVEYDCRVLWVEISYGEDGKPYAELSDNSGFEDTAKYDGMIIELK